MTELTILFRMFELGYMPTDLLKGETASLAKKNFSVDTVRWAVSRLDDGGMKVLTGLGVPNKWGNNKLQEYMNKLMLHNTEVELREL